MRLYSSLRAGAAALLLAAAAAPLAAQDQAPRLPLSDLDLDAVLAEEETPSDGEPAAAPAPPVQPGNGDTLSAAERERLEQAVVRGRQLAALAQAAQLATRDMLGRIADPEEQGIAGWVADPEGNAIAVTFYAETEEGPVAVYRGRVLAGRVVSRDTFLTGTRPALSRAEARLAAAREATEALERSACTQAPFNVFVIPPASAAAPIHVYHVAAENRPNRYPLGGHYRATIAPDGSVADSVALAEGCADREVQPAAEGERPRPIEVRRAERPLPNEIDVFLSLWSGRPLLVAAGEPERRWFVSGEGIVRIRD